jgi:phosphoribosylaminoimidazolecarboxamide formyltransferase/IMP cyclohydrolase
MAVNIVSKIDDLVAVKNAIVSVSNKAGLETMVPALIGLCPKLKIYSTGGTYNSLKEILKERAKRHLFQVSDYTGQPEMQGGLVKTLDWKIYLGLLSETYNAAHQQDLKKYKAVPFDLVIVNLYPFEQTVARAGASAEEARANIDIGGPCMVRASAKNYIRVCPVVNPGDYNALLKELEKNRGSTSLAFRREMAQKAFEHTGRYDRAIAEYFGKTGIEKVRKAYREIVEEEN